MNILSGLREKSFLFICFCLVGLAASAQAQPKKALTFEDIMKFKEIRNPVLSDNGTVVAYATQPDRGDGEAVIHHLSSGQTVSVPRGTRPQLSSNSMWAAVTVRPSALDLMKESKDRPKQGMALVDIRSGEIFHFEKVEQFVFSEDSKWLAYLLFKEEQSEEKTETSEEQPEANPPSKKTAPEEKTGTVLVLRSLETGQEMRISHVLSFAFDSSSDLFAYVIAIPGGTDNGLYYKEMQKENWPRQTVTRKEKAIFSNLTWAEEEKRLAFLSTEKKDDEKEQTSLLIWDGKTEETVLAAAPDSLREGWFLPEDSRLTWTRDGQRLFFGLKPERFAEAEGKIEEKKEDPKEADLFDREKILEERGVDVWHWNDPYIVTNQKVMWPRLKGQTYLAVYDLENQTVVQLADEDLPSIQPVENPEYALSYSDVPYRRESTWSGGCQDLYLVSLKDGSRRRIASRIEDRTSLSPAGRFVAFYKEKNWHLYDTEANVTTNLTAELSTPFYDEDHDYPSSVPSYGLEGWAEKDQAVLICDKYDIWRFSTQTGEAVNITESQGRRNHMTFRILTLDSEKDFFEYGEVLLLSSYHNLKKNYGFYSCTLGKPGVRKLLEEEKRFGFLAKAKKASTVIYTRESFEEFPDIWASDLTFSSPQKISDVNPQIEDFAWGKAELVEWNSLDGIPLQGVLIKPAGFEQGKRCPVIVYFYRFFSQRLHEFNQMVVNHRPNFPFYTSNGYAVFLPDIRFEIGHPGFSATKCLVPGVQRLIDMGVADPQAIGLHGHSWSGYQTAFVITQTNIFACAIAGAPVSNMTSAYSGIRWQSGLARQFQYEKAQSRIGGSLWEVPELYIENSPVFFADRIKTSLLIMFGDEDGAVPWYQGIELYLAMRRLEKDCVFLQYRGEPHHPQKYANKLDYSIKMKEYFDHYLMGKTAAEWIAEGVPYTGK
jgi:dipeptidyl aminopeptidase/acylaminoacyl peptidase